MSPVEKPDCEKPAIPRAAGAAVVFAALAVRVAFLVTTERGLDHDECVVGVMVRHIALHGDRFAHLLGSDYGGGHAFIAYLEAIPFLIFGNSDILVQSVTVLFSVLTVAAAMSLGARLAGPRAGLASGALLAVFPPFLKASFQVNGYVETIFFLVAAAILLHDLINSEKTAQRTWLAVALGLCAGLALWCFEFAIVFLAVFAVIALARIKTFRAADIVLSLVSFLVGYSLQLNTMLHDPSAAGTFRRWAQAPGIVPYGERIISLLFHKLPRFFTPYIYHYQPGLPWYALAGAAGFFISCVIFLFSISGKKENQTKIARAAWILPAVTAYYILLKPFFIPAMRFPRYWLPLAPVICLIAGIAAAAALSRGGRYRIAGAAVVFLFGVNATWGMADMARCRPGTCHDSRPYRELVSFLDSNKITAVYTGFNTKWHIAFYSNERIAGSDFFFNNLPRYLPYDRRVAADPRPSYIFSPGSPHIDCLEKHLERNKIKRRARIISGRKIIYDIHTAVHPYDWMHCRQR